MNKFAKISAVALFSLFLTACDGVEDMFKSSSAPAERSPVQVQVPDLTPQEELTRLLAWGQTQQPEMAKLQNELQQSFVTQNVAQIVEAGKVFDSKFVLFEKALIELPTKNSDVNTLKMKMLGTMMLSKELVGYAVQLSVNPKLINELNPKIQQRKLILLQLSSDVQKTTNELVQKFGMVQK